MFKIGISGKMGSGKSTLAKILKNLICIKYGTNCHIDSFGKKVKILSKELFNSKKKIGNYCNKLV